MEKERYYSKSNLEGLEFDEGSTNLSKRGHSRVRSDRQWEERMEALSEQIQESTRLMAIKTEQMSVKIRLLEERLQGFVEDFQNKLTSLAVKGADRPRLEVKIQEVIEKHNQVVRTFENRLNQMKRVVENQEIELYKATNDLQEARRELARLKRS